jgi:L,D-transpeptidase YcbB
LLAACGSGNQDQREATTARPGESQGGLSRPTAPDLLTCGSLARAAESSEGGRALLALYQARGGRPIWLRDGDLQADTAALPTLLHERLPDAATDFLGVPAVEARLDAWQAGERGGEAACELELALSSLFVGAADRLAHGFLRPDQAGVPWQLPVRKVEVLPLLERVAEPGGLAGALAAVDPPDPRYAPLLSAAARYEAWAEAGGFPMLPFTPGEAARAPGDPVDPAWAEALARRLSFEGYLEPAGGALTPAAPGVYRPELVAAVERFQAAHGLLADGKIGRETVAALNVSARARAWQLRSNLERLRWSAPAPAELHVVVDLPAFRVRAVEAGQILLELPVVVGKADWQTPLFEERISSIVLNPYWNVPDSIALEEVLVKVQADPTYLEKEGLEILAGWGGERTTVDATTVDWAALGKEPLPFRFRQRPGRRNLLGRIKFNLPNHHSVYLHDTPSKGAFARSNRALSHGCVRVQEPFRLAEILVRDLPRWAGGALEKAALADEEVTVVLSRPVPIYFTYPTAEVGADGRLRFYRDLYGVDEAMERAWRELSPRAPPPASGG